MIVVTTLFTGAWLHTKDRVDWTDPRGNMEAYWLPTRPRKKTKGAKGVLAFSRRLFTASPSMQGAQAQGGLIPHRRVNFITSRA